MTSADLGHSATLNCAHCGSAPGAEHESYCPTVRGELDDRALAFAVDALYTHDYGPPPREHGYPAPIFGPTREQAIVAIRAYLGALDA